MKTIVFLALLLLGACGTSNETAGSVSETTNGSIAGTWTDTTGTPLPGATVSLFATYGGLNARSADTALFTMVTDTSGSYGFQKIPTGVYTLVAESPDGGLSIKVDVVVANSEGQEMGAIALASQGHLSIQFAEGVLNPGDKICLGGTGLCVAATAEDSVNALVTFSDIPQGTYSLVLLWPASGENAIPLRETPVVVGSAPVTIFPDFGSSGMASGGFGGNAFAQGIPTDTVKATNHDELRNALTSAQALVVLVADSIQGNDSIAISSSKILLGTSPRATLLGFGLRINKVHDVWIRNITLTGGAGDAISIENGSSRILVEHNTLSNFGDELLIVKSESDSVTVAWNVFFNQTKNFLIGSSDNATGDAGHLRTTIHHNWFKGTTGMNPRVRFGIVHVYNNLFTDHGSYGIASTQQAKVLVENNVFWNVKQPTLTQHTSVLPGDLYETGNLYYNCGTPQTLGPALTASEYYAYTPNNAEDVETLVRLGAGAGIVGR